MNIAKEDLTIIIRDSIKEALNSKQPRACMTITECAQYCGIGEERIRELVSKENTDFPFFKVGVKTLINKLLLDEWLEKIAKENRKL